MDATEKCSIFWAFYNVHWRKLRLTDRELGLWTEFISGCNSDFLSRAMKRIRGNKYPPNLGEVENAYRREVDRGEMLQYTKEPPPLPICGICYEELGAVFIVLGRNSEEEEWKNCIVDGERFEMARIQKFPCTCADGATRNDEFFPGFTRAKQLEFWEMGFKRHFSELTMAQEFAAQITRKEVEHDV